jgi:hypothetical protein
MPQTRNGGAFILNFCFQPRNRMFGLLIGIDTYKCTTIRHLQGCERDAQSMKECLADIFRVPSDHFFMLANEAATRSAIIAGFENRLTENSDIERGDAIIIFYAGHCSRAMPEDRMTISICPHDAQTLDDNGGEIFGIPDRTIGELLRKLASAKGDNIVRLTHHTVLVSS